MEATTESEFFITKKRFNGDPCHVTVYSGSSTRLVYHAVMVVMDTDVRIAVPALHIDLQYIYLIEKQAIFFQIARLL